MSLSANQKKGLGIIISSLIGVIVGIFVYVGTDVPEIFPVLVQSLSVIANFYGVTIVYKNPDE